MYTSGPCSNLIVRFFLTGMMDDMSFSLVISAFLFFCTFARAETGCDPCRDGVQKCYDKNGMVITGTFLKKCGQAPINYCTPCVQQAPNPEVGIQVSETGSTWITYRVVAKGPSGIIKLWCGSKEQPCDKVMAICEKVRAENKECSGLKSIDKLDPSKTAR